MPAIVNMKMKWYPEAIQSHKPDVIFVDSSELESYDNYKKLSKIAPVIPFTDYVVKGSEIKGNQRIMECKVRLYARALGVSKRGELLIRKIRSTIKNALNTHPSLKRKHVIVTDVYLNSKGSISIGSLNLDNPRTGFLYDVGLPLPKALKYLNRFSTISGAELPTYFSDIDVFVPYNPSDLNADKIASLQADQYAGQIPAIKNGRIIQFDQNNKDYGLISYSYPLSILWGLNTYLDMIEKHPRDNILRTKLLNEFDFNCLRDNMAWQASGYIQRSRKIVDKVDSILKPTCPQSADHLRPVVSWDVGFVSPVVVVGAFRVGFFVVGWGLSHAPFSVCFP